MRWMLSGVLILLPAAAPASPQERVASTPPERIDLLAAGEARSRDGRTVDAVRALIWREKRASVDRSIRDGRRSGQLGRAEARGLRKTSRALDETADRYAADGHLSAAEQSELSGRADAMKGYVDAQRIKGGK